MVDIWAAIKHNSERHGWHRQVRRQKHFYKNTDSKIGPGGWEKRLKTKENDQKQRKPTEPQGPCPDLKGFCIKVLTVIPRKRVRKELWAGGGELAQGQWEVGRHYLAGLTGPENFKDSAGNLQLRTGFGPEAGTNQSQNIRHTTIPNDYGPISACFGDDPTLLNCEIAQPSLQGELL